VAHPVPMLAFSLTVYLGMYVVLLAAFIGTLIYLARNASIGGSELHKTAAKGTDRGSTIVAVTNAAGS